MRSDNKEYSLPWRRLALVAAMTGFVILGLLLLPSLAEPQQFTDGWQPLFSDHFEADFPGPWIVTDTSTLDGGEYLWGAESITYTSPLSGVWAVGGGAQGSLLDPSTDTYTNNVSSWLVYGPLDLSDVWNARVEFNWWLDTAPGDWLQWCIVTDPDNLEQECQGTSVSGRIGTWVGGMISLKQYARSSTPLWVVFHFASDDDGDVGRGAFLDDVVVEGDYGYHFALPLIRWDATPTPTPTPTPAYYYDNFDDDSSGWPDDRGPIYWDDGVHQGISGYWYRGYRSGQYRIYVEDAECYTCDRFKQPDALAPYVVPTNQYCVEASLKFVEGPYWANMGLVFGANSSNSKLYILCLSRDTDPDRLGWFIVRQDNYEIPFDGCHAAEYGISGENRAGTHRYDWNDLQVSVSGNNIDVFIGGYYKGSFTMDGLVGTNRVGLIGGSAEILPVDVRARYFRVIPNAACTP